MNETTYAPAPGITVRQRISVKQTAKGEFQRDYTVEVTGRVVDYAGPGVEVFPGHTGPDVLFQFQADDGMGMGMSLQTLNDTALRRAEADYQAHIARIRNGENGDA